MLMTSGQNPCSERAATNRSRCAARRWTDDINSACLSRDAGGSRTHWMRFCRPPPHRVTSASMLFIATCRKKGCDKTSASARICLQSIHPRPVLSRILKRPCQESNLVYDLRRVACFRYTSRTNDSRARPRCSTAIIIRKHPAEESNPVRPLRRRSCSLHTRRATCSPSGPATGFAPASFRLQGGRFTQSATPAVFEHEREDSNPIQRLWRPRALPGARSCSASRGAARGICVCDKSGKHTSCSTAGAITLPGHKVPAAIVTLPVPRSSMPR